MSGRYFIVFNDETLEEALKAHGGITGGFTSLGFAYAEGEAILQEDLSMSATTFKVYRRDEYKRNSSPADEFRLVEISKEGHIGADVIYRNR